MDILEIVKDLNTTTETLALCAKDDDRFVRYYVSIHPNTSSETLESMADDENHFVRYGVLKHLNTPEYIKEYISIKKYINETIR